MRLLFDEEERKNGNVTMPPTAVVLCVDNELEEESGFLDFERFKNFWKC